MIAVSDPEWPPRAHELRPAGAWLVREVCCSADIETSVRTVLAQLSQHPYSISDGLAVQFALEYALERVHDFAAGVPLRFWFRVTSTDVSAVIDLDSGCPSRIRPHSLQPGEDSRRLDALDFKLLKSYMLTAWIEPDGRRLLLRRQRGQSPVGPAPPAGYDFQI